MMIDLKTIQRNLNNTLSETKFDFLGHRITGKVRDIYDLDDRLVFIATDRQSAFDRHITSIPFKGQVLNQSSLFWFEKTRKIIPNHLISSPDPSVMIAKKLKIFPIEFVVRGYLTGVTSTSVWTAYRQGEREFCGHQLPDGMKKNQAFKHPLVTPTTKSNEHDEKISPQEICQQGLMSQSEWDFCQKKSLELFQFGNQLLREKKLILVDTKYEFGADEAGNIFLCDEIHTPDSSRFWILDSYEESFQKGQDPRHIDKEVIRIWLKENSDPYGDQSLPPIPEELIVELSSRYIEAYEIITGERFVYQEESIQERIETNLRKKIF